MDQLEELLKKLWERHYRANSIQSKAMYYGVPELSSVHKRTYSRKTFEDMLFAEGIYLKQVNGKIYPEGLSEDQLLLFMLRNL
jgi:hypothetical protein